MISTKFFIQIVQKSFLQMKYFKIESTYHEIPIERLICRTGINLFDHIVTWNINVKLCLSVSNNNITILMINFSYFIYVWMWQMNISPERFAKLFWNLNTMEKYLAFLSYTETGNVQWASNQAAAVWSLVTSDGDSINSPFPTSFSNLTPWFLYTYCICKIFICIIKKYIHFFKFQSFPKT